MAGTLRPGNTRALFMISVAAELAGMHPQTLRIYEQKGLITPARTPKNTRLYSEEDIVRLRYIQRLTTDLGMNLAGVEKVIELEGQIESLHDRIARLRDEMEAVTRRLHEEVDAVHKSYKRELVLLPRNKVAIAHNRKKAER
ncbi:MAG: helix-turn-helix transcriptional regulator [Thermoleophilia bacterium]|nr:helix-turn-helix transcriptional regulator [Thermoleophilia bacterium]